MQRATSDVNEVVQVNLLVAVRNKLNVQQLLVVIDGLSDHSLTRPLRPLTSQTRALLAPCGQTSCILLHSELILDSAIVEQLAR